MPTPAFSSRPVRRIEEEPSDPVDQGEWPGTLAPVRQWLDEGFDFGPVTVFVGDNGVGKSTLVEALAMAFGLNFARRRAGAAVTDGFPFAVPLRLVVQQVSDATS